MMKMKKFIQCLLWLLLSSMALSVFAYNLPNLGDPSERSLSLQDEKNLGEKFMQAIRNQLPLVSDPFVVNYIQTLGAHLVSSSPKPKQHFYFFIVRDSSINAFAGPAGYVGVNSGLIFTAQTESELAAVIAHETSHVIQRHIARGFEEQKWLTLSTIAGMLAGIAAGVKNPNAGMGVLTAATAGGAEKSLSYSRDFEREADHIGIQTLANAGFDPCSMPTFFGRLARQSSLNGDHVPDLLRSHPVTEERLADASNRCEQFPLKARVLNSVDYLLMRVRLADELNLDPLSAVRRYDILLKKQGNANNFILQYGYALALSKAHRFKDALPIVQKLVAQNPSILIFQITEAEIDAQMNNRDAAMVIYKALASGHASYYPLMMSYATFLFHTQAYVQARKVLEPYQDRYQEDDVYLDLLFQVQGRAHDLLDAYQTRAQLYLLYGDLKGAIQQLQLALESAQNDLYQKRKINEKIQQIKDQMNAS